jgi:hypothetical protein
MKSKESVEEKAAKWDRILGEWRKYCLEGVSHYKNGVYDKNYGFDWDYESRDTMRALDPE